jgi:hypothetical protein
MGTSETGSILLLVSISTVSRKESYLLLFKIIVPDYEVIRPFKFFNFLIRKRHWDVWFIDINIPAILIQVKSAAISLD